MTNLRHEKCEGQCCGLCCTKIENFGVTKGSMRILENVNMHIHCGELTAIIGPNGAGKTTLLKALLGEVAHTGDLTYLDFKGLRNDRPMIGYVPQQLSFDLGTPTSVLDLFTACRSRMPAWIFRPGNVKKRALEGLARVKAEHLIDRRLGALSGGELQRVMLALALDPVPNLLLLDEPVSGIDQGGLELFYRTVSDLRQNYDLSIILVSHDLELVQKYADRVIMLNRTVISSGTPKQVFGDERTMKSFGVSCFFPDMNAEGRAYGADELEAGDAAVASLRRDEGSVVRQGEDERVMTEQHKGEGTAALEANDCTACEHKDKGKTARQDKRGES